jgi:hypothetical protein
MLCSLKDPGDAAADLGKMIQRRIPGVSEQIR